MQNHDSIRIDRISNSSVHPPAELNQARGLEMLNPETMLRLENLDLDTNPEQAVSAYDKATAILVAVGEKPAAFTYTWGEPYPAEDPPKEPHDSSVEYANILHGLGLYTFTELETMDALPDRAHPEIARRIAVRTIYMARTEQELTQAVDAATSGDRFALGRALGYPDTSTQAFVDGVKIPTSQVSDDPALKAFGFFMLSPDNYEAELAVAAKWAEIVRQVSPTIYRAAVDTVL